MQWKTIPGYDDRYLVNKNGRFKEKRKTAEISLPLFDLLDIDFTV